MMEASYYEYWETVGAVGEENCYDCGKAIESWMEHDTFSFEGETEEHVVCGECMEDQQVTAL